MRRRLVDAAAHVLAEQGPAALTARKVSARAGISTMGVYTHFGSMEALVRATLEDGFRLMAGFLAVEPTDDPLRDVARQTRGVLDFASAHAELYAVMFLTMPLGSYRGRTPDDLKTGRPETLDRVAANLERAVHAGRLDEARSSDLVFTWWSAIHGYAMLESSGHISPDPGRVRVLERLLAALYVGLGDSREQASRSVTAGLRE